MTKPLVDLQGLGACGATIAWYEPESRALALEVVVEAVRRFLEFDTPRSIELRDPSSGATVHAIASAAEMPPGRFDLALDARPTGFEVEVGERAVDVRLNETPLFTAVERFSALLEDVLRESQQSNPDSEFLYRHWFEEP
jgi:hypothetical protein